MSNTNKHVLITGASAGIGYKLAKLFVKDQYNLVLVSRNQQELDSKAEELKSFGGDVLTISNLPHFFYYHIYIYY